MSLEYTQPHDQSVAPSLVIDMANPRILVLFRQASPESLLKSRLIPILGACRWCSLGWNCLKYVQLTSEAALL